MIGTFGGLLGTIVFGGMVITNFFEWIHWNPIILQVFLKTPRFIATKWWPRPLGVNFKGVLKLIDVYWNALVYKIINILESYWVLISVFFFPHRLVLHMLFTYLVDWGMVN